MSAAIQLRPATDASRAALVALRVSREQLAFVGSVADGYLEAQEEPDGRAIQFGLYDGDTLVGFVMLSDEVGNPSYVAHYLGSS
jgi:diamine N-acetyltransferase